MDAGRLSVAAACIARLMDWKEARKKLAGETARPGLVKLDPEAKR